MLQSTTEASKNYKNYKLITVIFSDRLICITSTSTDSDYIKLEQYNFEV
jgi:hypothetical protein